MQNQAQSLRAWGNSRSPGRERDEIWLGQTVQLTLVGVLLVIIAYDLWLLATWAPASSLGQDFGIYQTVARSWLESGSLYRPDQLAGPYMIEPGHSMYPPPILALILPFAFLPAVLWWIIPIGTTATVLWRLHPRGWGLVAILALLAWPTTLPTYWTGNPAIWAAAGLALATLYRPIALVVLIKPVLAPFALFGARDRRWWVALAAAAVLSAPLLPLWRDYIESLSNARGDRATFVYYLSNVPIMLVPLTAWFSRSALSRSVITAWRQRITAVVPAGPIEVTADPRPIS